MILAKDQLDVMIREEEEAERVIKQTIPREPTYSVPPIRMHGVPGCGDEEMGAGVTLLAAVLAVVPDCLRIVGAIPEPRRWKPRPRFRAQVQRRAAVQQAPPPVTPQTPL